MCRNCPGCSRNGDCENETRLDLFRNGPLPNLTGVAYSLLAIVTRLDVDEIPSGSWTFQRRSLWSTWRIKLARVGGWSTGESTSKKSRPICTTGIENPFTSRRMVTWEECPP